MISQLLRLLSFLILFIALSASTYAQGAAVALDTNGAILRVDIKTGALTEKAAEALNNFILGATARNGGKFYYVGEPSGSTEKALYTVKIGTGQIGHIDLDRNDQVRDLFFNGNKLFGIFYDGNAGTAGIYRINVKTGVTTLIIDLSTLDIEPIAGAITSYGKFYYILAKPESDSSQRRLVRFTTKTASAPQVLDVVDSTNSPVLCDKLKPNVSKKNFVCLASKNSETQVDVCRLTLKGKATVLSTLPNILRVGGGHTMLTLNQKDYYAFVYAPGEPNNQRLIKFTAKGTIKSNLAIDGIMIGGHFAGEEPLL